MGLITAVKQQKYCIIYCRKPPSLYDYNDQLANTYIHVFIIHPSSSGMCVFTCVCVSVYYTLWPKKRGLPEFEYSLAKVHESFKFKNYDKYIVTQ